MDKQDPSRPPTEAELDDVNTHWDEDGRTYDPNRGDHVDVLNDTTPPPALTGPKYPRTERRKKKHGWIWFLLLLLVAGGAYYYIYTHKPSDKPAKTTSQVQTTKPSTAIATTHYDSATYFLGLDYPTSWKLNDGDTALTVTSPKISLKTAAGKQVEGYIQFSVQNKQTALPAFAKGSAVAVIASQKITYKNPTQNQRAQSYISFASYASTVGNGWDALYITGDNGYEVGQAIPESDILQDDPLVTVSFLNCTDQTCSGTPTAYTLSTSEWKDSALSKPILTIIDSLSFN